MMKNEKITRGRYVASLIFFCISSFTSSTATPAHQKIPFTDTALIHLSERLLYYVKTDEPTATIEATLYSLDKKRLTAGLSNDDAKKTFWLNVYNAWYQLLASRGSKNPGIFTEKLIPIAGIQLSLEEIEQGILRKDYRKLRKADTTGSFSKQQIKLFAVSKIDYRIHFALNCGAKSCPPIAFYSYNRLTQQLDLATRSFLISNTTINEVQKEISASQLMEWYKTDFGGKKGTLALIGKIFKKDVSSYSLLFAPYNWEEALGNFTNPE
jgi:Protein of unknown function, DUF547